MSYASDFQPLIYSTYPANQDSVQATTIGLYQLHQLLAFFNPIRLYYPDVAYLYKPKLEDDNVKEEPQAAIKEEALYNSRNTPTTEHTFPSPHSIPDYKDENPVVSIKHEMFPKQEWDFFEKIKSEEEATWKAFQARNDYLAKLRKRAPSEADLIKAQLYDMIIFFMQRVECFDPQGVQLQRQKYAQNASLLEIFQILDKKYADSGKTREDMTRSCIRKALTYLRDEEKRSSNSNVKDASLALVNRYFPDEYAKRSRKGGPNLEKKLLALLPYKESSINKTPNIKFISKLFASETFCRDYQGFLDTFETIIDADNQKKIETLVDNLYLCVRDGQLEKIKGYRRLPWMDKWVQSTKTVAVELLTHRRQSDDSQFNKKKFKK